MRSARTLTAPAAVLSLGLILISCGEGSSTSGSAPASTGVTSVHHPGHQAHTASGPDSPSVASTSGGRSTAQAPTSPVTIAFAGDVHFASFLAGRLHRPRTALGPLADQLAAADLSIVNLETAVTTRGTPEPKEFTFRAPPVAFTALKEAGVDVVTMANNHGLDYGPVSVPDALSAAKAASMPVIGLGEDAAAAFQPWVATVHGRRIAFLAATAVVDSNLIASWSAGPHQPGVATALDGDNDALVDAVKAVRPHVDTVVVDLHYGSDLMACPTAIQRELASDLVRAGADVIVGQHAHVLLGGGFDGRAYVDYGLGNFQFYVPNGDQTAQTGVLTVTVDGRQVTDPEWTPGQIVDGLPVALTGTAKTREAARWDSLRACAGLTTRPGRL